MFSNTEFLDETVLKHFARVVRLQFHEQKAMLSFRHMQQELLHLLLRVVARDLLDDGFSLQSVRQCRPYEQTCEIDPNYICQRSVFLGRHPQVPAEVSRANRQGRYQVGVIMHHSRVVDQIVEDPKNLRDELHRLLGLLGHPRLEVHLFLERLSVELVEEGLLFSLVDSELFLDIFFQRIPIFINGCRLRVQVDPIEHAAVVPQEQIEPRPCRSR